MKPGKLYRFTNIAEPIKLWDFKDQGGYCREIYKNDVLMLVKIEKAYNGCFDLQFLHKDKIGWIMIPHRNTKAVEKILEEIECIKRVVI
jgi:hypothetical protein